MNVKDSDFCTALMRSSYIKCGYNMFVEILIGLFKGKRALIGKEETLMIVDRVGIQFNRV